MKLNDETIRTPEDLKRTFEKRGLTQYKVFTVDEKPPELKIYTEMDGLTGAEIKRSPEVERLSALAKLKIQLEAMKDILKRRVR